jgi:hypothetical protein
MNVRMEIGKSHFNKSCLALITNFFCFNRFKVDMDQFPIINRISKNLENIKEFADAHPDVQPDAQP